MDDEGRQLVAALTAQVEALTAIVRQQSETLARLAAQTAPARKPSMLVSALYEEFEKAHRHTHSWRMTFDKLAPTLRRLGHLEVMELSPQRWEKHRQARRAEPIDEGRKNAGNPPSEATLNVELGVAKGMCEWAVEQGYIDHNPLRPTKYAKTKGARKSWIPEAELQRLLKAPRPALESARDAFHFWLLTMADTGLRSSEALMVRRDRTREVDGETIQSIDYTKGGKTHTVGWTPRMLAAAEKLHHVLRSPYYLARTETGRAYGKRTVYGWFREACTSIGLDTIVVEGEIRLRPHDARRSAATNAHERGADLFEVQAMLNHSSPATTAKYIQRTPGDAIKIARLMAGERRGPHRTDQPAAPSTRGYRGG